MMTHRSATRRSGVCLPVMTHRQLPLLSQHKHTLSGKPGQTCESTSGSLRADPGLEDSLEADQCGDSNWASSALTLSPGSPLVPGGPVGPAGPGSPCEGNTHSNKATKFPTAAPPPFPDLTLPSRRTNPKNPATPDLSTSAPLLSNRGHVRQLLHPKMFTASTTCFLHENHAPLPPAGWNPNI